MLAFLCDYRLSPYSLLDKLATIRYICSMATTSIRIKKEQHQTLSAIAKRRGMTITALLYRILSQYFGDPAQKGRP